MLAVFGALPGLTLLMVSLDLSGVVEFEFINGTRDRAPTGAEEKRTLGVGKPCLNVTFEPTLGAEGPGELVSSGSVAIAQGAPPQERGEPKPSPKLTYSALDQVSTSTAMPGCPSRRVYGRWMRWPLM